MSGVSFLWRLPAACVDEAQQVIDGYMTARNATPKSKSDLPTGYRWLHDLLKHNFPNVSVEHSWVSGRATTKLTKAGLSSSFVYPIEGDDKLAIGDGSVSEFIKRARVELAVGD